MPCTTVSSGQSIYSIARDNGFFWQTIWNHGGNAELRSNRKNPTMLLDGDAVEVPERVLKTVSKPTDARHEFKRKGDPVKYRLRLLRFGEPRANLPYVLEAGGERIEGTTDGDGALEHYLPGNAKSGTLYLDDGRVEYPIRINRLDPPDTVSGAQQRLQNLGIPLRRVTGELDDATCAALRRFQESKGLAVTGELDASTAALIESLHP